jgi:hypothetical protein
MLPTDLSYLAQERCKELRGEIRVPSTPFFEVSFKKMFAKFFYGSGNKQVSQPKPTMTGKVKPQ